MAAFGGWPGWIAIDIAHQGQLKVTWWIAG